MSLYARKPDNILWVDARWRGCPRLQLSTGTKNKTRARAMLATLRSLRDAGRLDVLRLLATHKLDIVSVHAQWTTDPASIAVLVQAAEAPALGALAEEWLGVLQSPGALSPRTHREYAAQGVRRYVSSLNRIFATLPEGRATRTTGLTRGAILAYREARRRDGVSGATINRDLGCLMAFRRWCAEQRGIVFAAFRMPRERESSGRMRWLDHAELSALRDAVDPEWLVFLEVLVLTGMRTGEAFGLHWSDVRFSDSRISIGMHRRVKTPGSVRDVPFGDRLAALLVAHARTVPSHPTAPLFPAPAYTVGRLRGAFTRALKAAKLPHARVHDLRHTFGVHAVQAGVALPRLQKLMGHASPLMTLRYAAHAPEAYFAEDAARVERAAFGDPKDVPQDVPQGVEPTLRVVESA